MRNGRREKRSSGALPDQRIGAGSHVRGINLFERRFQRDFIPAFHGGSQLIGIFGRNISKLRISRRSVVLDECAGNIFHGAVISAFRRIAFIGSDVRDKKSRAEDLDQRPHDEKGDQNRRECYHGISEPTIDIETESKDVGQSPRHQNDDDDGRHDQEHKIFLFVALFERVGHGIGESRRILLRRLCVAPGFRLGDEFRALFIPFFSFHKFSSFAVSLVTIVP